MTEAVQDVVCSILVVGALTCIVVWEIMFYEFELGQNAGETTKNIWFPKSEVAVDYSTITGRLKKFCSGWKNRVDQARSGRSKNLDSEAMLQTIEANMESINQRVSGELSISQSSVSRYLRELSKSTRSCLIVSHVTKILQNFWLTQVFAAICRNVFILRFTLRMAIKFLYKVGDHSRG